MNSFKDQQTYITDIELSKDRRVLTILDNEGARSSVGACYLRQNARDAVHLAAANNEEKTYLPDDLEISHMEAMGPSGINIQFSDGHNRAIYPYSYLLELLSD